MIIAIDTGGTKTLITSFDHDMHMGGKIKFPTPTDPTEYIKTIKQTIDENFDKNSIEVISVASPGVIKNGTIIWGGGNLCWKNFDLVNQLKKYFSVPILINKDSNLGGLGETRLLNLNLQQVLYVTISTGIGSAIIGHEKLDPIVSNSEAGHIKLLFNNQLLEWEKIASGKTIYQTYGKLASEITDQNTWLDIIDRFSIGFLTIIPLIQPDAIIIGGSVGTYFDKYADMLVDNLQKQLPHGIPCPRFIKAQEAELAVIYGCYYYAVDEVISKNS